MRMPLLCAAVLLPAAAGAQSRLDIAPYFASYYPTNYTSYKSQAENERQEPGPGVGIATTYRFARSTALQGSVAYVSSGIIPSETAIVNGYPQTAGPRSGALTFASARVLLYPGASTHFALGPGMVRRSGRAWTGPGYEKLTTFTVVSAIGTRVSLRKDWALDVGVDAQFYKGDPDGPASRYDARMQHDFLVTIGVPFTLMRR